MSPSTPFRALLHIVIALVCATVGLGTLPAFAAPADPAPSVEVTEAPAASTTPVDPATDPSEATTDPSADASGDRETTRRKKRRAPELTVEPNAVAGCSVMAVTGFGEPVSVTASRGTTESECYTVTPTSSGTHLARLWTASDNWSAYVTITEVATGNRISSTWYALSQVSLTAGVEYRVDVTGDTGSNPPGYRLGLIDYEAASCAPVSGHDWDSAPTSVTLDHGSEVECRDLALTADTTLVLGLTTSPSTIARATIFGTDGWERCGTRSGDEVVCSLVGAAPYRLVVSAQDGYSSDGLATVASVSTVTPSSTQGCTVTPLAEWGAAMPGVGTREGDAECFTFTTATAGNHLLRIGSTNNQWNRQVAVFDNTGSLVTQGSMGIQQLDLLGNHTYRVVVSGSPATGDTAYSVGLIRIAGSTGCTPVDSLAWDSPGQATAWTTGDELHCLQFTATRGDTIRGDLVPEGAFYPQARVYDATGAELCVINGQGDDCALGTSGPYRVVLDSSGYYGVTDIGNAELFLSNYATAVGCAALAATPYDSVPPVTADRTTRPADCLTFTPTTSGAHLVWSEADDLRWGPRVEIRGARGNEIYHGYYSAASLTAGTTYRLVVTGDTGTASPSYRLGVTPLASQPCPTLATADWSAGPVPLDISGPLETECLTIPGTSGTTVQVETDSDTVSGANVTVRNNAGDLLCYTSMCTLSGPAPYRLVVKAPSDPTTAGTIDVTVRDLSSTTGCVTGLDGTTSLSADPLVTSRNPALSADCLVSGLKREDRAYLTLDSLTTASLRARVFNRAGDELCSVYDNGQGTICALTGLPPYRVQVEGPKGDDSAYRVALRRLNAPLGCTTLDSIATGISEVRGNIPDPDSLACVRFEASAGDQLSTRAVNPNLSGTPEHRVTMVDPAGNHLCQSGWGYPCETELRTSGTHALLVTPSGSPGAFRLTGTCLNPACGPDVFTVASVSPNRVGASDMTTVHIQGKALSDAYEYALTRSGVRKVGTVMSVSADGRTADVSFDLADAANGAWSVEVTSPSEGTKIAASALTVESIRKAEVKASMLTLGRFVAGRPQTVTVTLENIGNVDAFGVPVVLDGLPAGSEVTPKFDVYDAPGAAGETAKPVAWNQEQAAWVRADGTTGIPFYLGRLSAGAIATYEFTVNVPVAADYTLKLRVSECTFTTGTQLAAARKGADARGFLGFGEGGCTDAIVDTALSFIPGHDCIGAAAGLVTDGMRWASEGTAPSGLTTLSGIFGHALGAASCVTSFIPAAKAVNTALGVLGDVYGGITNGIGVANECIKPGIENAMNSVASLDPNELVGPSGGGDKRAIAKSDRHTFAVYFENDKTASAPAQEVRVEQVLNPAHYDLNTLRFGAVQFGNFRWSPPSETDAVDRTLDLERADSLQLKVVAGVNRTTGKVSWKLTSTDPVTGLLPEDPFIGFLPPNHDGVEGQGVLYFDVKLKDVPDGTVTSSYADIYFDLNEVIRTNTWSNLVDKSLPTATVAALPAASRPTFNVSWSASDAVSGVQRVEIYVSTDGGPYTLWRNVSEAGGTLPFSGTGGTNYAFSAIAVDQAGNASLLPPLPHATTRAKFVPVLKGSAKRVKALKVRVKASLSIDGRPAVGKTVLVKQGTKLVGRIKIGSKGVGSITVTTSKKRKVFTLVYKGDADSMKAKRKLPRV